MGKVFPEIDDKTRTWMAKQHMYFVSTAPRADDGLVNCSPKGGDTLRVVDNHTLAYLDYAGSGVETIAHLRENGRIVLMMCAFSGPPRIFRFHGTGDAVTPDSDEFAGLASLFDTDMLGVRSIIRINVSRISDSCGFGVPKYDFQEDRDAMRKWAEGKGPEGVRTYVAQKNAESLDGLPGVSAEGAAKASPNL